MKILSVPVQGHARFFWITRPRPSAQIEHLLWQFAQRAARRQGVRLVAVRSQNGYHLDSMRNYVIVIWQTFDPAQAVTVDDPRWDTV